MHQIPWMDENSASCWTDSWMLKVLAWLGVLGGNGNAHPVGDFRLQTSC